jgi:hypothetical protein
MVQMKKEMVAQDGRANSVQAKIRCREITANKINHDTTVKDLKKRRKKLPRGSSHIKG